MAKYFPLVVVLIMFVFGCNSNVKNQENNDSKTEKVTGKSIDIKPTEQINVSTGVINLYDLRKPQYANETYKSILDRYKGRVVYLEFWHSECNSCIQQFPHSVRLHKYYNKKHKDIDFVYMSEDVSYQSWKDSLVKYNAFGDHYYLNKKIILEVDSTLHVNGNPAFYMYDREGNLIDKVPWPEWGHTVPFINNVLDKN
jgi:thiol-disulfide isomerase/thioredoxin